MLQILVSRATDRWLILNSSVGCSPQLLRTKLSVMLERMLDAQALGEPVAESERKEYAERLRLIDLERERLKLVVVSKEEVAKVLDNWLK